MVCRRDRSTKEDKGSNTRCHLILQGVTSYQVRWAGYEDELCWVTAEELEDCDGFDKECVQYCLPLLTASGPSKI